MHAVPLNATTPAAISLKLNAAEKAIHEENQIARSLPGTIRRAGKRRQPIRRGIHVANAVAALFRTQRDVVRFRNPVGLAGDRIFRHRPQVIVAHQIV